MSGAVYFDLAERIAFVTTIPNVKAIRSLVNDCRGREQLTFAEFTALKKRCADRIDQLAKEAVS